MTNVGPELLGKSFQVLKEAAPQVSRVAVLFNPANLVEALALKDVQAAAARAGIDIHATEVRRGVCGLLGVVPPGTEVSLDMDLIMNGRTVRGILAGDSISDLFIPRLTGSLQPGANPF